MSAHRLRFAALLFAIPSAMAAAPILPCVPDSLANYYAMGETGCSIGNEQFFNFAPVFGSDFDLTHTTVIPRDILHRPTIEFQFDRPTVFNEYLELLSGYSVRVLPGGRPISQAALIIANSSIRGLGFIALSENLCPGTVFVDAGCVDSTDLEFLRARQTRFKQSGYARFDEQSELGVVNDFIIGFSVTESHPSLFFGSAVMELQEIPEPGTAVLVAAGLVAAGLVAVWSRRRVTLSSVGNRAPARARPA